MRVFNRWGISLVLLMLPAASVFAAGTAFNYQGVDVTVEPVIGYQFTHLSQPTLHSKAMFIYGLRANAGNKLISGELEYTRGSDNEIYPSQGLTVNTAKENLKLGVLTHYQLNPYFEARGRLGGQASREKVDSISASAATTSQGTWTIHPYLGAGLEGGLSRQFSLTFDITYVFNSVTDLSQNDIQTTLGVKVDINSFDSK